MKITFDFSARQIQVEGDGPELYKILELARAVAPKLPELTITTVGDESPPENRQAENRSGNGNRLPMREWARRLSLSSQVEKVVALTYYATKMEDRPSVSPKDISEWFTHCGFLKPSQMSVVVWDAKKKYGYLERSGHGQWRLTSSGENLIIGKVEGNGKE